MMLISRSASNTARNIRRTKLCTMNFIPDEKRYLENCVMLGFPGETTRKKMRNSIFTLLPSMREHKKAGVKYPKIVQEAVQVLECTWDDTYPSDLSQGATGFLLRVEELLLREDYSEAILRGMDDKHFPRLPIGFGYRDNLNFWFQRSSKPFAIPIPKEKGQGIPTVMYQAKHFDPSITWTKEACQKIVRVPRLFLNRVIAACVEEAKKEGISTITAEFMDRLREKRSRDKAAEQN